MRRAKRGIFVVRPGRCTAESSSSKCIILIEPVLGHTRQTAIIVTGCDTKFRPNSFNRIERIL